MTVYLENINKKVKWLTRFFYFRGEFFVFGANLLDRPQVFHRVWRRQKEFKTSSLFKLAIYTLKRNPIYVFPEKELRGLSPNFHIHVSVSEIYITTIGPHIFLHQNRQTNRVNK
jgi:hypothetical protein